MTSRKLIGSAVIGGLFTAAFFLRNVDFTDYANMMLILFGTYVVGNVGEHFAKR